MIEELQMILNTVGDLTGIALWGVGFFIVFKLVIYVSTTGAIVYLSKMFMEKSHNLLSNKPKRWVHLGRYYPNETKEILEDIYNDVFSNDTHYSSEAKGLKKAWDEYKENR